MSHPVDDDTRTVPTDRGFRASDADRQLTVMVLQEAVSRGLLTPEEGGERMAAAWAAVHHEELPPLTADLPPAAPTGPARSRTRSGRGGHGRPDRSTGTGWQVRLLALWSTVLGALGALVAMIGGTGRHRRLRLAAAAVVAALVVVAGLWLGGHVVADGDFPRGGGRMPGGAGGPGR